MPLHVKEFIKLKLFIIKKKSDDSLNKRKDMENQKSFEKIYKQAHKFLKEQNG